MSGCLREVRLYLKFYYYPGLYNKFKCAVTLFQTVDDRGTIETSLILKSNVLSFFLKLLLVSTSFNNFGTQSTNNTLRVGKENKYGNGDAVTDWLETRTRNQEVLWLESPLITSFVKSV